ncbi:MAG TPA: DUF3185 domain-containing protein [Phycisphaerae bacterium]|jgi:uncharacterized membrane protein
MRRTPLIAIGVILVVLGAVALIWQGVSYTQRETLVNVGGLNVTADTKKTVPLSPILGGIALAGGVGLIVVGSRK